MNMSNISTTEVNISASTVKTNDPTARTNDLDSNYTYFGFGLAAVVVNVIIIAIFRRNPDLWKKSSFFVGLSFGDIINGIGMMVTGIKRVGYWHAGTTFNLIPPLECMKGFTSLWLLGIQMPTAMMLLIATERVIAVVCFAYYYKKWNNKLSWYLTAFAYFVCLIMLAVAWVVVYQFPPTVSIIRACMTPYVVGSAYSTFNYGFPIFSGAAATVTTALSLIVFLRKKAKLSDGQNDKMKRFVKRQVQITISMVVIAVIDLAMVVIPNIILLMLAYDYPFPPTIKNIGAYASLLYCARSVFSIFVYAASNSDFRQCLKFQTISKVKPTTSQTETTTNRNTSLKETKHM